VETAVKSLASCYSHRFGRDAVFLVPDPVAIHWGHISVLDADLKCMRLLLRKPNWHLFVNAAGSELPLVPYSTLIRRLRRAGTDVAASYPHPADLAHRIQRSYYLRR